MQASLNETTSGRSRKGQSGYGLPDLSPTTTKQRTKTSMKHNMFALPLLLMAAVREEFVGDNGGGATAPANAWMTEPDMTPIDIRVNGVSGIKFAQPATVEKYDSLAKVQGRCLADACAKHLFHSAYGDIRSGISAKLVETGEGTPKMWIGKAEVTEVFEGEGDAKKLTGYTDAKGKSYKLDSDVKLEADKAFFDRVCAEKGVEASYFTDLIQSVANANPFDPSRKTRTAGPRKIAKTYLEAAQGIIDAGDAVIAGATAQLSELLDRPLDTSDPETRLTVLATAIADNELREKREREAKTKEKYLAFGQG